MRALLKQLIKMTAGYGMVQWAGPFLSLVFTPIIMRSLGPADYGIAEYILACVSALSTLSIFALPTALQTHYNDQQDIEWRRNLVGGALTLSIIFSLILGLPIAVFPDQTATLLGIPSQYGMVLRWVGLSLWMSVAGIILGTAAQSALRIRWGMILSITTILTILTSNILLIVIWGWGATGLVTTQLIVGGTTFVIGLILMHSLIGRPLWKSTRLLIISGATLLPTTCAAWIISVSDRFFLVRIVSATELGYYATAVKFASLLYAVMSPLYSSWVPLALTGQRNENTHIRYPMMSRYLVCVALFGSLGLALFSSELLLIIGLHNYISATPYIGILTYPHVFTAISVSLSINQMIDKKLSVLSISVMLGAAVNMLLNILLISTFGIWGAVAATVLGYGTQVSVVYFYARYRISIPYPMRIVLLALAGQILFLIIWIVMPPLPMQWRIFLKSITLFALLCWCIWVGLLQKFELRQAKQFVLNQVLLWRRI